MVNYLIAYSLSGRLISVSSHKIPLNIEYLLPVDLQVLLDDVNCALPVCFSYSFILINCIDWPVNRT